MLQAFCFFFGALPAALVAAGLHFAEPRESARPFPGLKALIAVGIVAHTHPTSPLPGLKWTALSEGADCKYPAITGGARSRDAFAVLQGPRLTSKRVVLFHREQLLKKLV